MKITIDDLKLLLESAFDENCFICLNGERIIDYYVSKDGVLYFHSTQHDEPSGYRVEDFVLSIENDGVKLTCVNDKIKFLRKKIDLPEYDLLKFYKVTLVETTDLQSSLQFLKND